MKAKTTYYTFSKQKLASYLNHKLPPKEREKIDKQAEEDMFLADALEGYQLFEGAVTQVPTWQYVHKKTGWKILLMFSLLILFLAGGWLVFNSTISSAYKGKTAQKSEINIEKRLILPKNDKNNTKTINTLVFTPQKAKNYPELKHEKMALEKTVWETELPPVETHTSIKTPSQKSVKIISFYQYMAVDYTDKYTHSTQKEQTAHLTGTPATHSHKNQQEFIEESMTHQQFSYHDFLKQGFHHIYSKNYQEGLVYFKTLLIQYPQDVNGQFYTALCYYHVEKYKEAALYFDLALNNDLTFFQKDAKRFKQLCEIKD